MTDSLNPSAGRRRPGALLAAGALAAALLAGCTPPPDSEESTPGSSASATPAGTPVSLVPGLRPEEQLLAVVLERHLENEGIPAEVGEPSAEPWGAAGAQQIAVVDTLAMASHLIPDTLAGEVPTPSPSPEPSGSSASPGAHPTATGSATPLPEGRPAADAQGTTAMVTEYFPEDTEVVGTSAGAMRLQAVATTALTGMYELEDLTDLNGRCDRLVFSPQAGAAVHGERLESLAGCEPSRWVEPGELGVVGDLVSGRADVVLMYGTDPAIPDRALEPLADPARILPEGRVLLVAEPQALPDGTNAALSAVADRLDAEMLAELQRLTTGPDQLPREEAAQYWLVTAGLEEMPDGWF